MRKIYFLALAIPLLFVGCEESLDLKDEEGLEGKDGIACTLEYRSISVQIKDKTGNHIPVQEYKAIVQRTGEQLHSSKDVQNNYYPVATDSDGAKLSKQGDIILVSAKHPT